MAWAVPTARSTSKLPPPLRPPPAQPPCLRTQRSAWPKRRSTSSWNNRWLRQGAFDGAAASGPRQSAASGGAARAVTAAASRLATAQKHCAARRCPGRCRSTERRVRQRRPAGSPPRALRSRTRHRLGRRGGTRTAARCGGSCRRTRRCAARRRVGQRGGTRCGSGSQRTHHREARSCVTASASPRPNERGSTHMARAAAAATALAAVRQGTAWTARRRAHGACGSGSQLVVRTHARGACGGGDLRARSRGTRRHFQRRGSAHGACGGRNRRATQARRRFGRRGGTGGTRSKTSPPARRDVRRCCKRRGGHAADRYGAGDEPRGR